MLRPGRALTGALSLLPQLSLLCLSLAGSTAFSGLANAQPRLEKGPYLMDLREDGVAVLAELSQSAELSVLVKAEGFEETFESERALEHEVFISGLSPSTEYTYTVSVGTLEASGSFETAPTPGSGSLRFLVYGDNRSQPAVHASVVSAMRGKNPDFLVHTGDFVATGADGSQWDRFFEIERELLASAPIFPALGNHELIGGQPGVKNWRQFIRVPDPPGSEETYYSVVLGPMVLIVLDSNQPIVPGSPQRNWLTARLAQYGGDTGSFLIAAMHHGPISSGPHGPHPEMGPTGVIDEMRDAGVDLVFSGHDHLYERGDLDGLKYIVTGGGGAPLYTINRKLPPQLAFEPTHHFLEVELDQTRVSVRVQRHDGTVLESCGFGHGEGWDCPKGPIAESVPMGRPGKSRMFIYIGVGLAVLLAVALWLRRR